ncbi:TPA: hypothetical protein SOL27_001335 [Clostridioides difficile]|nr:hypothetical protein [Clostridioides difficile]
MEKILKNKKNIILVTLILLIIICIVLFLNLSREKTKISIDNYGMTQKKDFICEDITISIDNKISRKEAEKILEKIENKNIATNIEVKDIQNKKIGTITEKEHKIKVKINKDYISFFNNGFELEPNEYKEAVSEVRESVIEQILDGLNGTMKALYTVRDVTINDLTEVDEIKYETFKAAEEFLNDDENMKNAVEISKSTIEEYNKMIRISHENQKKQSNSLLEEFENAKKQFRMYISIYEQGVTTLK